MTMTLDSRFEIAAPFGFAELKRPAHAFNVQTAFAQLIMNKCSARSHRFESAVDRLSRVNKLSR